MSRERISGFWSWKSCSSAATRVSLDLFLGRRNDGLYLGYYCSHPQVVKETQGLVKGNVIDREQIIDVVELHPGGYPTDYGVQVTLDNRCASCPFYKERSDFKA